MLDVKKDRGDSMWTLNRIFVVFPIIDGRQSGEGNVSVSIIFNFLGKKMKNIIFHQSYSSKYLDMIFSWLGPLISISAKYFAILSSSTYVGPRTMELLPNIFSLLYWSGELTENVPSHPSQNSVVPYNTVDCCCIHTPWICNISGVASLHCTMAQSNWGWD